MMDRRAFLKVTAATAGAGLIGACQSRLPVAKGGRSRPNIIFFLADDMRADVMGCAGNSIIRTPNIDRLAGEGVRFTNAFVVSSICCASRASIFTGQYARRHGINDFVTDFSASQLDQTYPALLKRAGYRIGFIGKYGVGENLPADRFDYWRGIAGQPVYEQVDDTGNVRHLTNIMGEQCIEFLECGDDRPFCLSVSFKAPHVQDGDPRQFVYDPHYEDLYKDAVIPTPELADEKYFNALPPFIRESEARKRWADRFSNPEQYQESVKGYYRLITGMDDVIGNVMAEFGRRGLDRNTIIIFSSDNGFYLDERGLAGKWFAHEESIRVPLIIRDPRMDSGRSGKTVDSMALNIDIAPTILELAGIEPPRMMQGRSLSPFLIGQPTAWRKEFFYEHLFVHESIPKSEALRTDRYKYIRYIEQRPVYEELYDLRRDLHETVNLAFDAAYSKRLRQFRTRCDKLRSGSE